MAGLGCCLAFRITIVSQKHVCLSGSLYTYCESIFIRGYSDTEVITVFEVPADFFYINHITIMNKSRKEN